MHHGAGVFVFDAGCLAVCQGEAAASLIVAEGDEGAFHLVVIGVAGDAHFDREHADTDEVLGGAEGLVRRVLFLSELVGGPQAVQVELAIVVAISGFRFAGAEAFFGGIKFIDVIESLAVHVQVGFHLAVDGAAVVHAGDGIQADAGGELIGLFLAVFENIVIAIHALHAELGDEIDLAPFLFQLCHADAQVLQFVCIGSGELCHSRLLLSGEAVLLRHELPHDLRQLEAGHILFPAECAVRVAVHHVLGRQLRDGLVRPVIGGYIGKRIRRADRYSGAGDKSRNGGFQKSMVHGLSP